MNNNNSIVLENSFSEFLLYTTPNEKVKVEIFLHNQNIWLTQEKIANLFDTERSVITKHLQNIYKISTKIMNLIKNQHVQKLHKFKLKVKEK